MIRNKKNNENYKNNFHIKEKSNKKNGILS